MSRETCPNCKSEMRGEPIPEKYFVHDRDSEEHKRSVETHKRYNLSGECSCLIYGDLPPEDRFYSRCMGYEIRGVYDGVLFWGCPDCGHLWPRFKLDGLREAALVEIRKMEDARLADQLASAVTSHGGR